MFESPKPWGAHRRRDVRLTLITALLVPAMLALCAWQLTRALSGNTLSWAYVFEWPLFAAYLVYMWLRLRSDDPSMSGGGPPARNGSGHDAAAARRRAEEDAALEQYNLYLAALAAQDAAQDSAEVPLERARDTPPRHDGRP
ncbi:MAG: hypothetical protein ACYDD4_10945 [Acidimicrobiales bacterium]